MVHMCLCFPTPVLLSLLCYYLLCCLQYMALFCEFGVPMRD